MTSWNAIVFDANAARAQLVEFRELLADCASLTETEIQKFLASRPQLLATIGRLNADADRVDRWAMPKDLYGKHECDLVVGDSVQVAYTLVEFEEASATSLFQRRPATPYWSPLFNHGYAQVVDWLCLLDGMQGSSDFSVHWGVKPVAQFTGVLLIGRRTPDDPEGARRMAWRSAKVRVNSYPVLCMTYDDLVDRLLNKLDIGGGETLS